MSDTSPSEERRGEARQPIELKVEYKRLNAFFADYTKNISRGGTFIQTGKPLPIGTEFVFKLYVPKLAKPIRIRGRVKWIVEPGAETARDATPGMGIRFVYQDDAERREVEQAVERLMVDSLGNLVYRKLMAQDASAGEPAGQGQAPGARAGIGPGATDGGDDE